MIDWFVCLFAYLFIYVPIYLLVCLFIYLFIYLFIDWLIDWLIVDWPIYLLAKYLQNTYEKWREEQHQSIK